MKKKIIILGIIIVVIVVAVVLGFKNKQSLKNKILNEVGNGAKPIEGSEGFAGGSGTQEDPYQISNINELQHFADVLNESKTSKDDCEKYKKSFYVLTNDIELNSEEAIKNAENEAPTYRWDPIGSAKGINTYYFSGVFDGQNHSISGLYNYIYKGDSEKNTNYIGLFGQLTDAEIKNLKIKNSYFEIEKEALAAGTISGYASNCKIDNIVIENITIKTKETKVGGVVGASFRGSSFTNCVNSGQIFSTGNRAGGILSTLSDGGTIENCTNGININVYDEKNSSGSGSGIVDACSDDSKKALKISNCTNNGTIKAGNIEGERAVSGIVFEVFTNNSLKDSINKTVSISNVINEGSLKGKQNVGGIITELKSRDNTTVEIKNATNTGLVEGQTVGGIVCNSYLQQKGGAIIDNCKNSGELKCSEYYAGGIAGRLEYIPSDTTDKPFTIKNCINDGAINGEKCRVLAGIFGVYETASGCKNEITIENCVNNGNISANTPVWMGGLVGYVQDKEADITLNVKSSTNNGQFNFNITEHENQDPEKTKGTEWKNYAGGIAAVVCKKANIENANNNGKLNEAGEKYEGIKFDDNFCYQAE